MTSYLRAFIERLGPLGFGVAVSGGLLAMLFVAVGATLSSRHAIPIGSALIIGLIGAAFGFFAVGTVVLLIRALASVFFGRSKPLRDGR